MSGAFKAGQMVSPLDWHDDPLDLFDVAPGRICAGAAEARVIGQLLPDDVALVVAIERSDGSSIYVIGPSGSGWAFGAFLKIVRPAM